MKHVPHNVWFAPLPGDGSGTSLNGRPSGDGEGPGNVGIFHANGDSLSGADRLHGRRLYEESAWADGGGG